MNDDPELKHLLKAWETQVETPPSFRAEVWERIGKRTSAPVNTVWERLGEFITVALSQPRYAIACLILFTGIGTYLGISQGDHYWSGMQARYVRSIDPIAQALQKGTL